MKKILLICIVILIVVTNLSAKEKKKEGIENFKNLGVGIVIGDPLGISVKFMESSNIAYAGVFGVFYGVKFYIHTDYLWLNYEAFSNLNRPEGIMILYYGPGVLMRVTSDDKFIIGGRGTVGTEYLLLKAPFGIFLEVSPAFLVTPEMKLSFFGGLGARFYF